uniref:Skp1_POZ domain-containing protein n=1 Tax=Panagrellus redivivus TaxID=6233 RepID=A0A7E4VHV4_PANRE
MVRKRKVKVELRTTFFLKTKDGHTEQVSNGILKQSEVLNTMFNDNCPDSTETTIPDIAGPILKVVVAFCRLHESDPPYVPVKIGPAALSFVDAMFLREHERVFNALIHAGDYLNIQRLVDAVLLYIRDNYVAGQRMDHIPKRLGLENRHDFGDTYEKAVQKYISLFRKD